MDFNTIYNYVAEQLTTNQFFSGAALTGVLMSAAYTLKSVPMQLWGRIERKFMYSVTVEQDDPIFRYLNDWTSDNYPRDMKNVELKTIKGEIQATHENDYIYMWYKKRYLRLSKVKQRLEAAQDPYNMFSRTYHISGLLARKAITDLIDKAVEYGKKREQERQLFKTQVSVYGNRSWSGFNQIEGVKNKSLDEIFLIGKDKLVEDLKSFRANKDRYDKLKIPFKRGYLFYGKPGNGKSSLAYAIADYMKYDVFIFDMSVGSPSEFAATFNSVPSGSVVVIEDIDAFYDGRKQVGDNKVSFSTFLNCLSGIASKEGIITVITTNKVETLDPALMREGRCDFKFELNNPTKELVEQFLSYVYDTNVTLQKFDSDIPFVKVQDIVLRNINNLEQCVFEIENCDEQIQEQTDGEISVEAGETLRATIDRTEDSVQVRAVGGDSSTEVPILPT